ncbi:MAG TPA: ion channel [Fimbriiglobus sp.]|nr:ion channel [Fimbriiglobus sp.]
MNDPKPGNGAVAQTDAGSTRAERLLRRRFLGLLIALGLLFVAYPALRGESGGRLLYDALLLAVFLTSFLIVFPETHHQLVGLLLAIPTVAGVLTGYVLPGLSRAPVVVATHGFATLFLGFTVAVILRTIYRERRVSLDGIYGAICGYLLIGVAFGHVYSLIEQAAPGSFHASDDLAAELRDPDRAHYVLTYFSVLTLMGAGFGDITPGSGTTRGVAVVEMVVGVFYVAVLIADLLSKRVSQVLAEQPPSTSS